MPLRKNNFPVSKLKIVGSRRATKALENNKSTGGRSLKAHDLPGAG